MAFGAGEGIRKRIRDAGNLTILDSEIGKAKEQTGLNEECRVLSVYEVRRDGFWIYRVLEGRGIESLVVGSASI